MKLNYAVGGPFANLAICISFRGHLKPHRTSAEALAPFTSSLLSDPVRTEEQEKLKRSQEKKDEMEKNLPGILCP